MPDSHLMTTLLVMFVGSGVFLRIVAKEKHRREKHLQLRLMEKAKELKEEEERKRGLEKAEGKKKEEGIITATPVDP